MTNEDVFNRWAAAAGPWAQWVKPSLIAQATLAADNREPTTEAIDWLPTAPDVALVLDLPGLQSIALGVGLRARGCCTVPMFNTTSGARELVPTQAITGALFSAAPRLGAGTQGPPVFLLDSQRQQTLGSPQGGDFDNRWFVFASDFPTEARFKEAGIRRITIVSRSPLAPDLHDALSTNSGLEINVLDAETHAASAFPNERSMVMRGLSTLNRVLHKNFDGSFGHRIAQG